MSNGSSGDVHEENGLGKGRIGDWAGVRDEKVPEYGWGNAKKC